MSGSSTSSDSWHSLRGVSTGTRLAVAVVLGLIAAVLTLLAGAARYAPAIGWDVAAVVLLTWIWFTIWPMGSQATESYATREDPSRAVTDVIVLAAAVASLGAEAFLLLQASKAQGSTQDVLAAVGVCTVVLSWALLHTVFTLRYALLYYSDNTGGIDFNQPAKPSYPDFAYLAFTIGMTFQVSDTDLRIPRVRATALRHSLLSYLFGAIILASTINLVAGLASSSG
jgi:uncharacterized membrane protein